MNLPSIAILAGGLATRLRPKTETVPKCLLEIAGKPFIAWQLELLRKRGLSEVVICTGHLGEMVEEYVGDGQAFGLRVRYSPDGPVLLGTGGAIRRALPLLTDPFLVVYGDSYLPCDYASPHEALRNSAKQGLMTVFRNEGKWDASNVEMNGGQIATYDKRVKTNAMRHIDYGLGVLTHRAFQGKPEGIAFDLAELYRDLLQRNELAAFEVTQRFYEAGSFAGIEELEDYLGKDHTMTFSETFLTEAKAVIDRLNVQAIEAVVETLADTRERGGRLFILGVGGSAANASHAVNDFRKIAGIEAYAPTDNVSELTARTNDEGWATTFEAWLKVSRLNSADTVLVLSVGGGDLERNVSPNLVNALNAARDARASIVGIVGRDGGYTAKLADACVIVPTVNADHITPHAEAFQAVVWHLIVSHPAIKSRQTKWESTAGAVATA